MRRRRIAIWILAPLAAAVATAFVTWHLLDTKDRPERPPVLGFDVPYDSDLEELAFNLFAAQRYPDAAPPFRPADSVVVEVTPNGCDEWVDVSVRAYLDTRWWGAYKARVQHRPYTATLRGDGENPGSSLPLGIPKIDGAFAFAVDGEIREMRASTRVDTVELPLERESNLPPGENRFMGRIPRTIFQNTMVNDVLTPGIDLRFEARWSHPRGAGSCWITLMRKVPSPEQHN